MGLLLKQIERSTHNIHKWKHIYSLFKTNQQIGALCASSASVPASASAGPGRAAADSRRVRAGAVLSPTGTRYGTGVGNALAMGNAIWYPVPGQSQNLVALSMEFPARVRCSFVGISTTQSRLIARPSRLTVISNFQLVF